MPSRSACSTLYSRCLGNSGARRAAEKSARRTGPITRSRLPIRIPWAARRATGHPRPRGDRNQLRQREIIAALVISVDRFHDLHQHVVDEGAGTVGTLWKRNAPGVTAAAQLEMMRRAHLLEVEEMKRAAEPIFVWGGGSAGDKRVRWEFRNEGGSVSHLTVTLPSPTGVPAGVQADISPKEWLGNSWDGIVTFDGNVGGEIRSPLAFVPGSKG